MEHTAEADRKGVMIALVPSKAASQALLDHSGGTEPLEDQHITLAYLGTLGEEVPDDVVTRDTIENIVGGIATRYAPLNGEANGWGIFHNEDDVVVALWNIPGINGLRQTLVTDLRDVGLPAKANFSYTPHQTMGYHQAADHVAPPGRLDHPVTSDFRYLLLTWGGEHIHFTLSGVRHEARGPARGGNEKNPGQFSSQDRGFRKKDKPKAEDKKKPGQEGQEAAEEPQEEPRGQETTEPENAQEEPTQAPEEGQEGTEVEPGPADAQDPPQTAEVEVEIPPGDDYTGTSYSAVLEAKGGVLTDEDKRAVGDLYGHFLPAGKYVEGDPRNEPEFERVMAEKTALVTQYEQGPLPGMTKKENVGMWYDPANQATIEEWRRSGQGGQTRDLHDRLYDAASGKQNVYSPERAREQHEIIRKFVDRYLDYPRNGKCVVMAGPPGAGKSTYLEQYGEAEFGIQMPTKEEKAAGANPTKNFVTINPDDFKDWITVDTARYPGLEENELAAMKHEESSHLAEMATQFFMSQGYDVIIDITLGSSASATRKYYEPWAEGYDFSVALVDGDMRNSLNNAGLRWKYKNPKTDTERNYGGRFLPMHLIEHNAPTKPGFRSKNAEQFMEFARHDKVSKAVVFDPYNPQAGSQPMSAALRSESEQARAAVLRPGNVGTEGATAPRKEARQMTMQRVGSVGSYATTEITEEIKRFQAGQVTEEALVEFLLNHEYSGGEECPYDVGTAEWYEWHEGNGYQPGTYDEVLLCRNVGLLPWETFHKVNDAMAAAARQA